MNNYTKHDALKLQIFEKNKRKEGENIKDYLLRVGDIFDEEKKKVEKKEDEEAYKKFTKAGIWI